MHAKKIIGILALIMYPLSGLSHHSVAANFDQTITVEIEGTITGIYWQNPHVLFTLTPTDENRGTEWSLETHSLSIMKRMDVSEPFVQIGDEIKAAGWPARQGQGLFVNNMLLPAGKEFVFRFGAEPAELRWSDQLWGTNERWFAESGDSSAEERGIFRVWSTTLAGGKGFFWLPEYPLTEEAIARKDTFNALTDNPLLDCALKGMPTIMSAPYPIEFIDRGKTIELRIEEYDLVRTIHMDGQTITNPEHSLLGYSTGRWDNQTLIVETNASNWGYFRGTGEYPLSEDSEFIERFSPTDNGSRLQYELTVIDPTVFTEPLVLVKSWIWLPDVTIDPYDCISQYP
ncbi:MAG: hypothetical protein CMM56_03510 [Rhodospirillaceae bacterium]|nr:hypothetical protein [Rhodospirillaceae bacterium]|tara:strand:+ start:324 stop:1355 length:1032 start_codon:yes stop_codon:yes gene_type:complete